MFIKYLFDNKYLKIRKLFCEWLAFLSKAPYIRVVLKSVFIMPYRRLPNTDSARLRAMQKALTKSENMLPMELPYSAVTLQELRYFLPEFKQAIMMQRDVFERQTSKNKQHQECFRKARLYISHFIQVLNFAIARGEMKPDVRKYFNLPADETKLPQLNTERDVIEWGKKLIDGEQKRLSEGMTPVMNPTIAHVKVHYENFVRLNTQQKGLQESNSNALAKISDLRGKADRIILNLWNEIEEHYNNESPSVKREKAAEYGVSYVWRKNEKAEAEAERLELNLFSNVE